MEDPILKAELVFIPAPGIGHLVSTTEFAQRLINHDRRFSATILNIQVPSSPLVGLYVRSRAASATGIRFIDLPMVDLPSPDLFQTPEGCISLYIQKHKPHVKHAVTNLISSESNTVSLAGLVIDMFCTSMIDVANELSIPCYLFFTSPAGFLGFMLHLPTLDIQTTGEFLDSGTELVIPSFFNSVHPLLLPTALLKREEDGYYWFLNHARKFRETDGIIVNTFEELEPHALRSISASGDDVPPIYPVGPLIDFTGPTKPESDPAHPHHHEKIMNWLDHRPPSSVVLLCFGSMGSLSEAQVREIAGGLERTGFHFLWSLRQPPKIKTEHPSDYTCRNLEQVLPHGFIERTAKRGLVCGWVPQVAVLAHTAIGGFVSHCGWNSIMESLWHGVPIATWPIYGEQQMNAFEMVKELELAVEIRLDHRNGGDMVLAEEIEKGLRRVMEGESDLRRKVKEMGEKSRKAVERNGSSYTSLDATALADPKVFMEAMMSEMRRVMKLELEQVHEWIDQMESAHEKLQKAPNVMI
ncbi:hypothetical protein F0562_019579 [Nyssa sinensis]|uniref:Glycosyltransferase n=1 Tax=Nyssa sinensis TaxID=561372 RepID=A0A5J5BSI4_9ASTE|nr:hypothetical protein F0562_019579 [Nyssa sinensis]